MKKLIMLVAVIAVAGVSNAGIYDWSTYDELSNLDPGFDLNTVSGKGAEIGDLIGLYQAAAPEDGGGWNNALGGVDTTTGNFLNGDTLVTTAAVEDDGGWLWIYETGVSLGVGSFYTVLFDAAAIADADQYIVLQTSTFDLTIADALPGGDISAFDGEAVGSLAWQNIPEPATIGLMGIAGLGMFLARKKTRR